MLQRIAPLFGAVAAVVLFLAAPAFPGTVSIHWDPVASPQLAGYRIYYSTVPGQFSSSLDVGTEPSAVLDGLADCTAHYVAVKAVDALGQESGEFSNVVAGWPRPSIASAQPPVIEQGQQVAITIDGANFQPGATVGFSDPAIVVEGIQIVDCTRLIASVGVAAGAAPGAVAVEVVNPDQVFGMHAGLLSVGADATAPVISGVGTGAVGSTSAVVIWSTDEPSSGRVYYRPSGDTVYQATDVVAGPATEHAVTLQGLAPQTAYEYHVESADPSGNSTTSAPDETFTTSSSSFSYIRIEAESGDHGGPLAVVPGVDAFRAASLELPSGAATGTPATPSGLSQYGFYLPYDGDWQVWLRVFAATGDGWLEGVDGVSLAPVVADAGGSWRWVAARAWTLDSGLHVLTLGGRNAGSRVDRVLVTDDPNFVPTEAPGSDVVPPDALAEGSADPANASVALGWTVSNDPDSDRVIVRFSVDGQWPQSPADGWPLVDQPAVPSGAGSFIHDGLTNGMGYRYAMFVVDVWGNASDPILVEASPQVAPPDAVENLARSDTK